MQDLCKDAIRKERDHDVGGLLKDARLLLQQGAAAKRELAALKSSSERQQQAYRDLLSQHEQLQEAALVLQAKLAAAQAVTGADRLLLKQLVPGLVAEAAAMLSDTATACNEGSHGEKPHRASSNQGAGEPFMTRTPGQSEGGMRPQGDFNGARTLPTAAGAAAALGALAPATVDSDTASVLGSSALQGVPGTQGEPARWSSTLWDELLAPSLSSRRASSALLPAADSPQQNEASMPVTAAEDALAQLLSADADSAPALGQAAAAAAPATAGRRASCSSLGSFVASWSDVAEHSSGSMAAGSVGSWQAEFDTETAPRRPMTLLEELLCSDSPLGSPTLSHNSGHGATNGWATLTHMLAPWSCAAAAASVAERQEDGSHLALSPTAGNFVSFFNPLAHQDCSHEGCSGGSSSKAATVPGQLGCLGCASSYNCLLDFVEQDIAACALDSQLTALASHIALQLQQQAWSSDSSSDGLVNQDLLMQVVPLLWGVKQVLLQGRQHIHRQ